MTTTQDVPMPEPSVVYFGNGELLHYTADQVRDTAIKYADARCAKLQAERDALAEKVKALQDDWQTLDRPLLKVFFMKGDDPFVFAAHGRIAGVIEEVEKDLRENPPTWFEEYGDGDYTFRANYFEGEYGEYGRCVFPAGWELDLIAFEPLKDAAIDAAGDQS